VLKDQSAEANTNKVGAGGWEGVEEAVEVVSPRSDGGLGGAAASAVASQIEAEHGWRVPEPFGHRFKNRCRATESVDEDNGCSRPLHINPKLIRFGFAHSTPPSNRVPTVWVGIRLCCERTDGP
jgi:hypothetical protein